MTAGGSARREFERRREARVERLRDNRGPLLAIAGVVTLVAAAVSQQLLGVWWPGAVVAVLALGNQLAPSQREVAWRKGIWLGTIAMAVPMVFMTLAFEDLPVSLGGLLVALIPLATIAAAHFMVEGERFQVKTLPGLLIALAGTALLVGVGGETATGVGDLWRGVGLMMTGVVIAGIGGALWALL